MSEGLPYPGNDYDGLLHIDGASSFELIALLVHKHRMALVLVYTTSGSIFKFFW